MLLRLLRKSFTSLASRIRTPGGDAIPSPSSSSSTSPGAGDRALLENQIKRFDPELPIEKAHTPPASWFTHPAFHSLELSTVFANNPIAVGSSLQLAKPGDYFTGKVGTHPFVAVRDQDNRLRAFYNVCRHKGMRAVVGECGHLKGGKIACTYHGWEYRLDGRLSKATRIAGIKDFVAKDYGMIPIPLETWGPLIFLHFGKTPNFASPIPSSISGNESGSTATPRWEGLRHLTPLLEALDDVAHGFSRGLRHVERRSYRLNCNWKVVIDNYCDNAYHVPYAHPNLGSTLDLDSYKATTHDGFSIQSCIGSSQNGSDRVGGAALYAHVYPNLMINRYGPWLDTNIVYPISQNRCEIVFDYFLEEAFIAKQPDRETLDRFIKESLASSDEVQQEDTYLCENVQIGLESDGYDQGRYAPRVEYPDYHFHVELAKELRNAISI